MKKTGDGRRVQRVEKEVQSVLSRFLMTTFTGDLPGIVSLHAVQMPADLRSARVFISIINGKPEDHERACEVLQARAVEIQRYLANELPMRYTPKLKFFADNSMEKTLKIDRILHEISGDQKEGPKTPKDSESQD